MSNTLLSNDTTSIYLNVQNFNKCISHFSTFEIQNFIFNSRIKNHQDHKIINKFKERLNNHLGGDFWHKFQNPILAFLFERSLISENRKPALITKGKREKLILEALRCAFNILLKNEPLIHKHDKNEPNITSLQWLIYGWRTQLQFQQHFEENMLVYTLGRVYYIFNTLKGQDLNLEHSLKLLGFSSSSYIFFILASFSAFEFLRKPSFNLIEWMLKLVEQTDCSVYPPFTTHCAQLRR